MPPSVAAAGSVVSLAVETAEVIRKMEERSIA